MKKTMTESMILLSLVLVDITLLHKVLFIIEVPKLLCRRPTGTGTGEWTKGCTEERSQRKRVGLIQYWAKCQSVYRDWVPPQDHITLSRDYDQIRQRNNFARACRHGVLNKYNVIDAVTTSQNSIVVRYLEKMEEAF
jgi:hypothetical protein